MTVIVRILCLLSAILLLREIQANITNTSSPSESLASDQGDPETKRFLLRVLLKRSFQQDPLTYHGRSGRIRILFAESPLDYRK